MDLKNLDLERYSRMDCYNSDVYEHSFPLLKSSGIPKKRIPIKLNPIDKKRVKKLLKELEEICDNHYDHDFVDSETFYTDPNNHQLYKFKKDIGPEKVYLLNIHFRTISKEPLTDQTLEALQESYMLRNSANCEVLDRRIEEQYKHEFEDTINQGIESSDFLDELRGLWSRKSKLNYLKWKSRIIFDTICLMKNQGYDPKEVLRKIQEIRVDPMFQSKEDPLLKVIDKEL